MVRSSSTLREVWVRAFLLVLLLVVPSQAQDKFLADEFGPKTSDEELMARLDALTVRLSTEQSVAVIRGHRGTGDKLAYPERNLARIKTYLLYRKVAPETIQLELCSSKASEALYQIYVVPPTATLTPCYDEVVVPTSTTLFDTYGFSYTPWGIDDCCSIPGADIASSAASIRALGHLLKRAPESRAVVIAYSGTNLWWLNGRERRPMDTRSKATSMALDTKRMLIKQGVAAERVRAINGGYRDSTRTMELWFVPDGGAMPKATPDYFPRKKRR